MIRNFMRTIIRCELLQKEQKNIWQRTISTSQRTNYQYLDELTDPNDIIVKSKRPVLHIPTITIDQYVWSDVGKFANYTAIIDGITGREMTYGDLRNKCRVLAIRLQKDFHLKIGDTIGVCLPNCPEYPIPTLAGIEAGMIVTIMNPYNTAVDMAKQLVDSETKMLFGLAKNRKTLEKAVELSKRKILIVYLKENSEENLGEYIRFQQFT
jgi:long-subunit acyl-CoA synthetase (AMP-forming)